MHIRVDYVDNVTTLMDVLVLSKGRGRGTNTVIDVPNNVRLI